MKHRGVMRLLSWREDRHRQYHVREDGRWCVERTHAANTPHPEDITTPAYILTCIPRFEGDVSMATSSPASSGPQSAPEPGQLRGRPEQRGGEGLELVLGRPKGKPVMDNKSGIGRKERREVHFTLYNQSVALLSASC